MQIRALEELRERQTWRRWGSVINIFTLPLFLLSVSA